MLSRFEARKKDFLIFAAFLAAVFLFVLNPIAQSDTGFLVKTGEYIWTAKNIPLYDIFSYTAQGARWVAHYWLPSVFFYLANHWFGLAGIVILVGLMAVFTFFFLLKTAGLRSGEYFLPILLTPIFFGLTFELWAARPQIFSYFFTVLLLFFIEKFRQSGKFFALYFIPPLMLLWANCHAGVILGLAIILIFVVTTFLKERFALNKETKKVLAVGLASLIAVFINPNGYLVLIYSFLIAPVARALAVTEWSSLLLRLDTWQAKTFLVFMVFVAGFMLWRFWLVYRKTRKVDFFELGLLVLAFALPLDSIRQVIFFPLLVFPAFTAEFGNFLSEKKGDLSALMSKGAVFLLFLALFAGLLHVKQAFGAGLINRKILPVGAADFILKENIPGPLFDLEEGSYLVWRLWPKEKVFLDGRNEVYRGRPVEDFLSIVLQKPGWEGLVNEKYKINYFILFYKPPLDVYANNLTVHLMNDFGFKLVYWDDAAIVLLRDSPGNESLIDKFAYRVINPFREPENIKPEFLSGAGKEIIRALNISPDSEVLYNYGVRLAARGALSRESNLIK